MLRALSKWVGMSRREGGASRPRTRTNPCSARPGVEALEDRRVPAALGSLALTPTRDGSLPLGSVFVGHQFQLSITATDVYGNPWTGSVTLSNTQGPDEGFAIPAAANATVSVTNGYGVIPLTAVESYVSLAREADVITATKNHVSASTTIITISSGFTFTLTSVNAANGNERQLQVYVPTELAGSENWTSRYVTITNTENNQTQTTNITFGVLATSYSDLYNWIVDRIDNNSGKPGTAAALQNNYAAAYNDVLSLATLYGVEWPVTASNVTMTLGTIN